MICTGFTAQASVYHSRLTYRSARTPALSSTGQGLVPSASVGILDCSQCWDTGDTFCSGGKMFQKVCCLCPTNGDVTMTCAEFEVGRC